MMRLPTILFFLLLGLLVAVTKVFAWDSSSAYNTIAMSYTANTTITQTINLSSAQRAESTINFVVDVKNGGGRPTHDLNGNPLAYSTQTDTASITIYRYNSAGQLLGQTTSQNYILYNYGTSSNPGWSVAPGDNQHPFTQATVSFTGDLSQVAYIRIEMKGTDGAWWAGNYGPQWRTPTVTVGTSTTNIVYNSEFGVAPNGVQAQGWTPSYGTWAACGVTSGNSTCVTQESGVTANMWGGGYDANGGTTSGTVGGYSGTLTSNNATQAASGTITPSGGGTATPTVTGTTTTYTTRTVTSGNTTYVYRTPVTTTNYSDGTSTSSNGAETLHQTKVASTVTTNTINGNTLTTINTPINTVTTSGVPGTTIEANGTATTSAQTIQRGLNFQVWRYDPKTYSCGFLGCVWNFGYRTPSTNIANYGNPVNSGITTGGIFIATNSDLPNNDSGIGANDGTVMRYYGTITAPVTTARPAGTVYRLYFYNNTDDGFVMRINGNTVINQNETERYQAVVGYTSNGWMDVVAGQTYNIEAWYWNTWGGFGNTLYWDYGDGVRTIPNGAYTTGTITNYTVDTTGIVYSNSSVVNITGAVVSLAPTIEGGTITMTNGTGQEVISSGAGSAGITQQQQSRVTNWNNGAGQNYSNYIYIEQISGSFNNVNVTQTTSTGKNTIEATIAGTGNNTIGMTQTGTNYHKLDVNGAYNNITTQQSNNSTSSNFKETTITGSSNIINTNQKDNANKIMFNTITGSNNSVTAVQEGAGNHYLENTLNGNNLSVIVNQSGNAANNAVINLTNSGGAPSVDLQQTGGKSFNLIQGCSNPAGCTTVVRQ